MTGPIGLRMAPSLLELYRLAAVSEDVGWTRRAGDPGSRELAALRDFLSSAGEAEGLDPDPAHYRIERSGSALYARGPGHYSDLVWAGGTWRPI